MNLVPTPEQEDLAAAAARFLEAEAPVRGAAPARHDPGRWRAMADLGWFAVAVPAAAGGAGGGLADQALLFRELGRGLLPGPLLGTCLGVAAAVEQGAEGLARSLMSGEVTAALAEPWRDPGAEVSGEGVRGRFRILEAEGAEVVTCLGPGAVALLPAAPVGAVARELAGPDPSVPVALAQLEGVVPELVLTGEAASGLTARGRLLTAALLVGILEAVRDLSVGYVSGREQFGRPVGSFQAVKHRCADMAVRAEAAVSLLFLAALTLDAEAAGDPAGDTGAGAGAGAGRRLAASVKALASEYAVASAHDNVQNHGGMGFTAECSAHLYVRRALEWSVTLGAPEGLLAEVVR